MKTIKIVLHGSLFLLGCVLANAAFATCEQECRALEKIPGSEKEQIACWKKLAEEQALALRDKAQDHTPSAQPVDKKPALEPEMCEKSKLLAEWSPDVGSRVHSYKQSYLLYAHSSNPNSMPTSPNPDNRAPFALLNNEALAKHLV